MVPELPEAPLPPPTVDVAELVSYAEGEADATAELEAFGGDLVDLLLLPLYPDHTSRRIWNLRGSISRIHFFNLRLF